MKRLEYVMMIFEKNTRPLFIAQQSGGEIPDLNLKKAGTGFIGRKVSVGPFMNQWERKMTAR